MAAVPVCAECLRLVEQHAQAKLQHDALLAELRKALLDKESAIVTSLILSEAAALRERDAAEVAFRRHISTAHGGGQVEARPA